MMESTIADRLRFLKKPDFRPLPRPTYFDSSKADNRLFLGVKIFERHVTSEGWQLQIGMRDAGYKLCGSDLDIPDTDVRELVERENPKALILQDKREWDRDSDICWDKSAHFHNVQYLKNRHDVFKLTILKDAQNRPEYHECSADEIGCHAWIVYYNPTIVGHVAPYVRSCDLIRTYHSVDRNDIPDVTGERSDMAILSGAVSRDAYPLRYRLHRQSMHLPKMKVHCHPGYKPRGHKTHEYLRELVKYKVSICTASAYGYALRKIIESTACGCVVVTDLPREEVLPWIDGNLVRIHPDIRIDDLRDLLSDLISKYDIDRQVEFSRLAASHYDYMVLCRKLSDDIELARTRWLSHCESPAISV